LYLINQSKRGTHCSESYENNAISDIIKKGLDKSAYFGLMALGSIGSEVIKNTLLALAINLKNTQRKELAKIQLNLEI
tara:strand:+ start:545 stop:778 length:234 start_codon:yes stop_codon:yes gene_type:complete